MKNKYNPEKQVQELAKDILHEIKHWKHIEKNGCHDPFWPDGCNMNLTRNHIIFDKKEITRICVEENLPIPEEYYLPTPPVVDNSYMARTKDPRIERLAQQDHKITHKKAAYDEDQMELI